MPLEIFHGVKGVPTGPGNHSGAGWKNQVSLLRIHGGVRRGGHLGIPGREIDGTVPSRLRTRGNTSLLGLRSLRGRGEPRNDWGKRPTEPDIVPFFGRRSPVSGPVIRESSGRRRPLPSVLRPLPRQCARYARRGCVSDAVDPLTVAPTDGRLLRRSLWGRRPRDHPCVQ